MPKLVTTLSQVIENIHTYQSGVASNAELASRIKQHVAWYALNEGGGWLFAPSKFIGYAGVTPEKYIETAYDRRDGKETEPTLREWFEMVDASGALGRELRSEFDRFAGQYDTGANSRWRVSVPIEELLKRRGARVAGQSRDRIVFDPAILGGRPHIRGTRVGVGHILAALAAGDSADEIVEELPYLTREDIQAALEYAAANIDHPVFVAA